MLFGKGCQTGLLQLWQTATDTSLITLSPEYAVHLHDIYIDGKEHAKMTGDRMKMLMLTLPFMVRDLIAPEGICVNTYQYILVYTRMY
jgi:hypothetical protein